MPNVSSVPEVEHWNPAKFSRTCFQDSLSWKILEAHLPGFKSPSKNATPPTRSTVLWVPCFLAPFFFWCPKTSAFSRCFPAQGPPGKTHERRRTSGMRSWKNSLWISWLGSRASGRRWMVVEGSPQVHHDTMVVKQDISMRIVMVSWWNCYGPMKCLGEIVMIPWLLWPMTWMISHGDNSMTWMGRTLWTLWTLGVWYPKLFLYPAIVLEVTMEKPPLQWIKICGIPTGKSSAQDLNFWRWDGFVWKCDTLW